RCRSGRLVLIRPTSSACTICAATSGNGRPTGSIATITPALRSMTPAVPRAGISRSCAAATGASSGSIAASTQPFRLPGSRTRSWVFGSCAWRLATQMLRGRAPMLHSFRRDRLSGCLVAALLVVHSALLAWEGWRASPTVDEVGHLPAGLSHWKFSRFDLYRVNPPLVRMLAASPLLFLDPHTEWRNYYVGPYSRTEFTVGSDFAAANETQIFWYFTLARWTC